MRACIRSLAAVTVLGLAGLAACGEPDPEPAGRGPEASAPPTPRASPPAPPSVESTEPFPHEPLERKLAGGQIHRYEIELSAGDYLHAVVDQRGVDVEVVVLGPRGEATLTLDTATPHGGTRGSEELHFVAERAGLHGVVVRPWEGQREPGRYKIRRVRQRQATPEDLLRTEAARLFSEAQSLWLGSDDDIQRAIQLFLRSRELWEKAGEPYRRALTEHSLGLAFLKLERWRDARPWLETALPELRAARDHWFAATTLHELARLRFELGETESVLDLYARALSLRKQAGDDRGEALTVHNLGYVYHALGRFREALDHYDRALRMHTRQGNRRQRAQTLHNRGRLLARLGRPAEAQMDLEAALRLRRDLGRVGTIAATLDTLGRVHVQQDNTSAALSYLERARQLREKVEDREGVAITWRSLGTIHRQRGDLAAAHAAYQRSLRLLKTLDEPRQLARTRREMGLLELERGRPEEALELLQPALDHFRTARDVHGEMDVLAGSARAYRQLGDLDEARSRSRDVLQHLEMLGMEPETYTLRSSYLASQQDHCDFHVDLLMEIGDGAGAFETHEHCRARALLALLHESGIDRFAGADPTEIERERGLARHIRALESHRLDLLEEGASAATSASPERIAGLEREIDRLLAEHTRLQARLTARNPRQASLAEPPASSLADIRKRLGERQSLLLEYRLGSSRSFLWAVTEERWEVFVLPGRDEIEARVQRAHDLLSAGHQRASTGRLKLLLEDLGTILLEPAAELLRGNPRVVIVGDGLLPLLPFSVLPLNDDLLLDTHEVTHGPSMSTLTVLEDRSPDAFPAGSLAVLADPVFSPDDPRFSDNAPRVAATSPKPVLRDARLTRLFHAGREAEKILQRFPASETFAAIGFEARRDLVTDGRLTGFRILHFATHARVDPKQPALSHLVFSRWTRDGEPIDGFLFGRELFGLELPTELVVLSACDTALGRQVRGEGLVGLTQGFFHAGASQVLATLWPVEDEATAELMDRFYSHLLEGGSSPAAALRQARLDIKKEPRWEAPYYWAGFRLQGF